MQFRVGAIPRVPQKTYDEDLIDLIETILEIRIYQIRTGFTMYFLISRIILSEALLGNNIWIHDSIKKKYLDPPI